MPIYEYLRIKLTISLQRFLPLPGARKYNRPVYKSMMTNIYIQHCFIDYKIIKDIGYRNEESVCGRRKHHSILEHNSRHSNLSLSKDTGDTFQ